jgi:hypothetical protein
MKIKKITIVLMCVGLFFSCSEDNTSGFSENLSTTTVLETINAISFDEDMEELVSEALELRSSSSARNLESADKGPKKFSGDKYGYCATVEIDEENNVKTVTFLGTCYGKGGQSRSGTMIISYSDIRNEAGSFRQVEYSDFYMNEIKIEGTRRTEVLSIDGNGDKTMRTTVTEGKMIYEDGTFKTKNSEMTRFTYREDNKKVYSTLTGSSSGISTEGIDFSMVITTPIKFSYDCFMDGKMKKGKVPVEGIKVTTDGDSSITTDFGDGNCDSLVEVTKDGEVETVDLKDIKRGDRFKNILKSKKK